MGVRNWDASYYRDACPQELFNYQHLYYTMRNMSEDCLHLNIFAPNVKLVFICTSFINPYSFNSYSFCCRVQSVAEKK